MRENVHVYMHVIRACNTAMNLMNLLVTESRGRNGVIVTEYDFINMNNLFTL